MEGEGVGGDVVGFERELTRMDIEVLKPVFPCVVGFAFIGVHSRFDCCLYHTGEMNLAVRLGRLVGKMPTLLELRYRLLRFELGCKWI